MINNQTDKLKISLFSKGSLVFKDSGHTLVKTEDYYRCSQQAKGECKKESEKLLKTKSLTEKLNRTIEKFTLPEGEAIKMFDRVFPLFLELNRNTGERDAELQEIIEPTILVILQDLLKDRKTNRQDMIDLRKYFFESLKGNYKIQLLSSLVDLIFILSGSNKETNTMLNFQANLLKIDPKNIRSNFARHLKTINLSDEGEIVSLEFEPWSWFCLKYLKANIPNYLNNIKSDYIVNKDDFTTLNPLKKLEELEANDFKDTYSYSAFASDYAKEKLMDKIFGDFERLDKDEKMKYLLNLNTLSFEFLYAYFATILSISDL